MVFILFFMRIFLVEAGVQRALDHTGRQAAVLCTDAEDTPTIAELALLCNARILADGIPVSYIDGDILGIQYGSSQVDGNYILLRAAYQLTFPVRIFGKQTFYVVQQSRNRKWVGWDEAEIYDGNYVYVTENGSVYHRQLSCSYLHPSVSVCAYTDLGSKRSEDGSKYKPCQVCDAKKITEGTVYITDYGTFYHSSLKCSSIKRTIYRKKLEELQGMASCSKCGG
jgi:hypothetical protein